MTNNSESSTLKPKQSSEATAAPEAPVMATEASEEAVNTVASEQLVEQIQQLEAKQEQLLRVLADKENSLRRANQDLDKERKYAISKLLQELLAIVDSMENSLKAVSDQQQSAIYEGVELTLKMLQGILTKNGVQSVAPEQGDAFDPAFHDAMIQQEDATVAAGSILNVLQKGYLLHDRLIRPALVVVAKAPAATQ